MDTLIDWLNHYRSYIHMGLHVLLPLVVAWVLAAKPFVRTAFILMMATMLVDIDHLLATPIYAPNRCSILFHPLHQAVPILIYVAMVIWPAILWVFKRKIKRSEAVIGWLGLGLVIHMLLDGLDCLWMRGS